tara:strand:+ start:1702 stop:1887 length:186 start_codon:yes stop_codon:yes gene_type:complete
MDLIQTTNKDLLFEIILDIKLIRNELQDLKNILKDSELKTENKEEKQLKEEDKINSWFWAG